jgi:ABC-type polar amino acid transport system ATPase subunit
VIRVRDLTKQFPGAPSPVLNEISFEVDRAVVVVVLGPSGAGKTTLLRCLAGLEAFDRGSIQLDDVEVTAQRAVRPGHALRGRVGLVFQSFELFPHLNVLDNCTLAPRHARGVPRATAEERALVLLRDLGIEDKRQAFPEHLSGGQRQRVAIARALVLEPSVLLYDEPTSALDPSLRGEVVATIDRVRRAGVTQIVVSHDPEIARRIADRVLRLEGGHVVDQGVAERRGIPNG